MYNHCVVNVSSCMVQVCPHVVLIKRRCRHPDCLAETDPKPEIKPEYVDFINYDRMRHVLTTFGQVMN